MKILNPALYRAIGQAITRENVDKILDEGELEIAVSNGRWWRARRNGRTKTWKKDKDRLHIPIKFGLYGYAAIEARDFVEVGDVIRRGS